MGLLATLAIPFLVGAYTGVAVLIRAF